VKYRTRTDAIVIHCTASRFGVADNVESIRKMHIERGFKDIGYHFLIGLNGEKWTGRRPLGAQGAHVRYFNETTLGVSYVGGLGPDGKPADTRTTAQTAAMLAVIRPLLQLYPRAVILGHRDLSPDMDNDGWVEANEYVKQCPCFDAGPWAKSVGLPGARFSVGKYVRL
jgi:N-acetyl-anhydromuramyl-L-alanine amidase AmpD